MVELELHKWLKGIEMNLQIAKLQLKAQPSPLSEVWKEHTTTITTTIVAVASVVADCMELLEQSFEVLTTLQEDPNGERLETYMCELQKRYDKVKGTVKTVALKQRFVRMLEEKALKE